MKKHVGKAVVPLSSESYNKYNNNKDTIMNDEDKESSKLKVVEFGHMEWDPEKQLRPKWYDQQGRRRLPTLNELTAHFDLIRTRPRYLRNSKYPTKEIEDWLYEQNDETLSAEDYFKAKKLPPQEEYITQKETPGLPSYEFRHAQQIREEILKHKNDGKLVQFDTPEGAADAAVIDPFDRQVFQDIDILGDYIEAKDSKPKTPTGTYYFRVGTDNQLPSFFKESYDPYEDPETISQYYMNLLHEARENWDDERLNNFEKNTGINLKSDDAIKQIKNELKELYPQNEYFPDELEKPWEFQSRLRSGNFLNPHVPTDPNTVIDNNNNNNNNNVEKEEETPEQENDNEIDEIQLEAEKKLIKHILSQYHLDEYADKFENLNHFLNARRPTLKYELGIPTKVRKKIMSLTNQFKMRQIVQSYGTKPLTKDKDPFDPQLVHIFKETIRKRKQAEAEAEAKAKANEENEEKEIEQES